MAMNYLHLETSYNFLALLDPEKSPNMLAKMGSSTYLVFFVGHVTISISQKTLTHSFLGRILSVIPLNFQLNELYNMAGSYSQNIVPINLSL